MKNLVLTLVSVLSFATLGYAQKQAVNTQKSAPADEDIVYMVVEEMPQFPDGIPGLQAFLASQLQYPKEAQAAKIQGTVFIGFVVNNRGCVTDVTVLKGIGHGCDEEAVRVVNLMPQWTPGRQKGQTVSVRYSLPIKFVL